MAGKYHRTYLDGTTQAAFEKMQADKALAGNALFNRAVKGMLEAEGYLPKRRDLKAENEAALQAIRERDKAPEVEPARKLRRRRRTTP